MILQRMSKFFVSTETSLITRYEMLICQLFKSLDISFDDIVPNHNVTSNS